MAGRLTPRGQACARKVLGMRVNHWSRDTQVLPPYIIEEVVAKVTEVTEQGINPLIAESNEEIATCDREADANTRKLKRASPEDRADLWMRIDRDRQTSAEARVRLKVFEIARADIRMGGCNRQTADGTACGNANLSFVDYCALHEEAPVAAKTRKKAKGGAKAPGKSAAKRKPAKK